MALFESLVGMLAEFAPILSFFRRSRELFEQMNSTDLEAAIEAVCEEMIRFCLGVVKYCQRKSASERPQAFHASLLLTMEANFLGMLFRPRLDVEFKEHNERLKKRITRAEREITLCGVQATQQGLHEVKTLVQGRPEQTQLSRSTKRLIRMIPYCQNGRFFGREAILDRLSEALDPARLPKRQSKFAIYGLGGCGKTQIALEYVYRHYDQYENILWVSSSSIEKIEKDFAEAAFLLGLGKPVMHANEARQFALQKLAEMSMYPCATSTSTLTRPTRCNLFDGVRQCRGHLTSPNVLAPHQPWVHHHYKPRLGHVPKSLLGISCRTGVHS
jgi:hypothetical protein